MGAAIETALSFPLLQTTMAVATLLLTLSLLSPVVMADRYCYYDAFGRIICRDRFSTAARIGIAVASFVVIFAILLAYSMYRRRRAARANIAVVHAPQSQQQGYPDQYPPLPQGGFLGTPPGGNGQKAQQGYDPQPYNGQYNPQYNDQYGPQYNGQYNQPYNSPQYPPATYDQGQPVPPYPGYGPPPGPPPQQHRV